LRGRTVQISMSVCGSRGDSSHLGEGLLEVKEMIKKSPFHEEEGSFLTCITQKNGY